MQDGHVRVLKALLRWRTTALSVTIRYCIGARSSERSGEVSGGVGKGWGGGGWEGVDGRVEDDLSSRHYICNLRVERRKMPINSCFL